MISRAQLEVYARFGGDYDGLARTGRPDERALVEGEVWSRLDAFRDGLARVRAGVAAAAYAERVEREVAAAVPDPAARAILERLADADAARIRAAG